MKKKILALFVNKIDILVQVIRYESLIITYRHGTNITTHIQGSWNSSDLEYTRSHVDTFINEIQAKIEVSRLTKQPF